MNVFAFTRKLRRLETQLVEAERLRGEFDAFRQHVDEHAETSKKVISSFLHDAQKKYENDILQIRRDKEFCERVCKTDQEMLRNAFAERSKGFPTLAKAFGEYLALRDDQIAAWLSHRRRPALRAAEIVRELKSERRALAEECKILRYLVEYYEDLFPQLADYRELESLEEINRETAAKDEDPARRWLSPEEYNDLPTAEKLQLALDRYWREPKSSWQLGRDYERYVGFCHERKGYEVVYQGIIKGLDDCGRDLICRRGEQSAIVQCKYWRQGRVVHEKHINQLFGTCVEFWLSQNPGDTVSQIESFPEALKSNRIIPRFVTSTVLSDTARNFAKALGVEVVTGFPLRPYPCIKCNVARVGGEKIYHLPFDQQYDKTVIETHRGECYVETVAEAEQLGFRRAYRWRPEQT